MWAWRPGRLPCIELVGALVTTTRDARWYEQERTRLHERALERERHSAAPPPPPSTSCLQLRVSRRARAAAGAMFMKF
jgi:hypothetical protein